MPRPRPDLLVLSPREREIMALFATGMTRGEIARKLFLSRETVRNHLYHAYQKMGVNTDVRAVLWWQRHGGGDE